MDAANPIDNLNDAKRVQQALRKNPNDIESLLWLAAMLGALTKPELDQKRKVLQRVLSLEPANHKARQMLLEMDRAAIGGDVSRLSAAVILTPQPAIELSEKSLKLRYSIIHQILIYPCLAFCLLLMFMAFGEWDVFVVFAAFSLALLIPVWFVSAVLEISHSGLSLSRLFGVYRRDVEWNEIEGIEPAPMGAGMKLTARDGRSLTISSQINAYSSIVEILRNAHPNLFDVSETKTFRKGFLAKYGLLFFLIPATPMAIGGIFVPPFFPGILITVLLFYLWRHAVHGVHLVEVKGNRLSIRSLRSGRDLTVQQIRGIDMVTIRNHRGVRKSLVQIELDDGDKFTLSGFSEGNEILYGFLKNWWNAYQNP